MRLMLLFCMLSLLAPAVYACECLPERSPRKELKISKAVFVGTVVETDAGGKQGSYKFRVESIWKGPGGEFITVSGGYGLCSRSYGVGETYLVYALEVDGELASNACMRSAPLEEAAADVKALGKGKVYKKVSAKHSEQPRRIHASSRPSNVLSVNARPN